MVFTRGRTKRDESNYITETESPWVEHAARGPHLAPQRERLGDRGRGHPGPRPRAHRGGDDLRQGPRPDHHAAAQRARLRACPDHGPLLHALGPLDPARLRLDRARGLLLAPRPQGLRPGQRRRQADRRRPQGLRRATASLPTTASSPRPPRSSSPPSSGARRSWASRRSSRPRKGRRAQIAGTGSRSEGPRPRGRGHRPGLQGRRRGAGRFPRPSSTPGRSRTRTRISRPTASRCRASSSKRSCGRCSGRARRVGAPWPGIPR